MKKESARIRAAKLGTAPLPVSYEADAETRRGLAGRFSLLALPRLAAHLEVVRDGEAVLVTGVLDADVVQACVVTSEPVPARVHDSVRVRFQPDGGQAGGHPAEQELEADDLDCAPLREGAIDIAALVAESLGLALDPYPRAGDAVLAAFRARHAIEADGARPLKESPFAVLKKNQP